MSTLASATPATIPTGTWQVDGVHSSIGFAVKHWGVSTFGGSFPSFTGSLATEGGSLAAVEGTVEVGSLVVNDPNLDGHLKSDDFFAVEQFPQATFRSTSVAEQDGTITLAGELTIRDITLPTTFTGQIDGFGVDAWGITRIGLDFEGSIDRTAFGVDWNAQAESGAYAVAAEVSLSFHIEATLQGGGAA
jgi:polyisoprenoid-binding protein YceI